MNCLLLMGRVGLPTLLAALFSSAAFADVVIGQVLPLSGPQAQNGRELAAGAKAYVDKVNAEGGVAGHKIIDVTRDDAGDPTRTLVGASELIARDKVLGLLEGASPAGVEAVVSSGMLRQNRVPMLGTLGGVGSPYGLAGGRPAGLIEISPPQNYVAPLLNEFKDALAKYGPPGETPGSVALQGYISAKVLVGALRMLGPLPTREEFFGVVQNMIPDLSNRLVISTSASQ